MNFNRNEKSFALVLSLFMISVVSLMVVAFLSYSQVQMNLIRGSASNIETSIQAREATKGVLALLLQEMKNHSEVTPASPKISYRPKERRDWLPRIENGEENSSSGILKVSGYEKQELPGSLMRSEIGTDVPSLNGVTVDRTVWNESQYFNSSSPLPRWIYQVGRSHQLTNTIGRFAYIVYDLNSKMDINAAQKDPSPQKHNYSGGYVSDLSFSNYTGETEENTGRLMEWKFPGARLNAGFSENPNFNYFSAHDRYVQEFLLPTGFQSIPEGGNLFINRKDLLRGSASSLSLRPETLLRTTIFSRSIQEPDLNPDFLMGGAFAKTINFSSQNCRVRSEFSRMDGTLAKKGDLLMKKPFPLSRTLWLTERGPSNGSTEDQISKAFGLRWNAKSESWDYYGSSAEAGIASKILTLDQVSFLKREANFFEILKAAILDGSLGLDAGPTVIDGAIIDKNVDAQIIRIGANIIDQWDSNSYPTVIHFDDLEFYGQENLPYISKLNFYAKGDTYNNQWEAWISPFSPEGKYSVGQRGGAAVAGFPFYGLIFYELWNPYQQIVYDGRKTGAAPSDLSLVPTQGKWIKGARDWFFGNWRYSATTEPVVTTPIKVANFKDHYFNPEVPSKQSGPLLSDSSSAALSGRFKNFNGYVLEYNNDIKALVLAESAFDNNYFFPTIHADGLMIKTTYTSPQNNQRSYSYFSGVNNSSTKYRKTGVNVLVGSPEGYSHMMIPTTDPSTALGNGNASYFHLDPRTSRFGLHTSYQTLFHGSVGHPVSTLEKTVRPGNNMATNNATVFSYAQGLFATRQSIPWSLKNESYFGSVDDGFRPMADMAENRYDRGTPRFTYSDRDGVTRWGDSGLDSDSQKGPMTINPMEMGASTNRPCILNRPARSTADLGYVYRDMPWKSLDFFTTNSADAGLLEVFTPADEPRVTAGRMNFNALNVSQIENLLKGVVRSPSTQDRQADDLIQETQARQMAATIYAKIQREQNYVTNKAEWVTKLASAEVSEAFPATKSRREALLRTFVSSTSLNTWNVMVDFVYEKGHLRQGGQTFNDFVTEGIHRYWMHVSLDRTSGRIIDCEIENASY